MHSNSNTEQSKEMGRKIVFFLLFRFLDYKKTRTFFFLQEKFSYIFFQQREMRVTEKEAICRCVVNKKMRNITNIS